MGRSCAEKTLFIFALLSVPPAICMVIFALLLTFFVATGGFMVAIPDDEMGENMAMALTALCGAICLVTASFFDACGGAGMCGGCCACADDKPAGCRKKLLVWAIVLRLLGIGCGAAYLVLITSNVLPDAAQNMTYGADGRTWEEEYEVVMTEALISGVVSVSPLLFLILLDVCVLCQLPPAQEESVTVTGVEAVEEMKTEMA